MKTMINILILALLFYYALSIERRIYEIEQIPKTKTVEITVERAFDETNRIYGYKLIDVKEVDNHVD